MIIKRNNLQQGFTLVEMSVVIVIISLLAGGTLVGKDLIRSAELKGVLVEVEEFSIAFTQFSDKFGQPPGDFADATEIWGHSTACGGADSGGKATCDGDGGGSIHSSLVGLFGFGNSDEWFYSWQHLSNSQMLRGKYTGQPGSVGVLDVLPGINTPESRNIDGAGWAVSANTIWLGLRDTDFSGLNAYPVISATDMHDIDTKIDDGRPVAGRVQPLIGVEFFAADPNDSLFTGCAYLTDGTPANFQSGADAVYGVGDHNFHERENEPSCLMVFGSIY